MFLEKSQASIRKGTTFVLRNAENSIHIISSSLNGKEKIYFNKELVSEKRNLSARSQHEFKDGEGNEYKVEIESINMSMTSVECRVYKNEELLKTFRTRLNSSTNSAIILWFTFIIVACLFGLFMSTFDLPLYSIIFLVVFLVHIYFFIQFSPVVSVTE